MDEDLMKKLALLQAIHNDDDDEMYVSSFRDANILLQQHMTPSGAKYRRALVEYITDPANRVLSHCDVIHNFVMDLFRVGDYDLAIQVCDYALEAAPYNRDMLGDAIKACGSSSQFDRGDAYLERAREIPLHKWNFRLFLYSIDFLKAKLCANPLDDDLYDDAVELAKSFIKTHPFDEHGYNQLAELYVMMNQRDEAIETLREFIFDTRPDPNDRNSELITAQCCVTLLDILDDSNDYDFIIEICDKGLRNTTQEQPSASIGYFVYRKALALDARAHSEKFKIPDTISDALKFYQSAYDLNQDRDYASTIEKRHAVLRPFAQEFKPLIKRKLYVEAEAETEAED